MGEQTAAQQEGRAYVQQACPAKAAEMDAFREQTAASSIVRQAKVPLWVGTLVAVLQLIRRGSPPRPPVPSAPEGR